MKHWDKSPQLSEQKYITGNLPPVPGGTRLTRITSFATASSLQMLAKSAGSGETEVLAESSAMTFEADINRGRDDLSRIIPRPDHYRITTISSSGSGWAISDHQSQLPEDRSCVCRSSRHKFDHTPRRRCCGKMFQSHCWELAPVPRVRRNCGHVSRSQVFQQFRICSERADNVTFDSCAWPASVSSDLYVPKLPSLRLWSSNEVLPIRLLVPLAT